jgi:hypothetical protein
MPSISGMRVPPRYMPVLKRLSEMDGIHADQLLAALSGDSPVLTPQELSTHLESVDGIKTKDDADRWSETFFSLQNLHITHGWSLSAIAEKIAELEDLALVSPDSRASFSERLAKTLAAPRLAALAKAIDVATEQPAIFHTARIISDIRPTFGDDADEGPTGAVVTSTLKIEYYAEGRMQTFYLTVDASDAAILREIADRAVVKMEKLKTLITSLDLPVFDLSGDD